jgi:ribonuclease R
MSQRLTGTIDRHKKGYGFLIPDEEGLEDIFIPPGKLNGSMSGDRVEIQIHSSGRGEKDVGSVTKILERNISTLIGTIQISPDKSVVVPNHIDLDTTVVVPDQSDSTRVNNGDVVEVEIQTYEPLRGIIVDVLGRPGDPEVEEKIVLKKYNLKESFPDQVINAAKGLPDQVPEEAKQGRRDLTDLTVLTIDPVDAKDLDDAVSVEVTENGNFLIGVHITDVSHYIEEGGELDEEAVDRATSTYLADKVIPMFPKEFSNGIGSLKESAERLSVTVFLTVSPAGEVLDSEFCKSFIEVDRRLSYEEVDRYLETPGETTHLDDLSSKIDTLIDVSQKMRARRMDRGSLDFDLPEVSLRCSEGEVEEIIQVEHTLSHQAIEEFMIAANEAVARYLTENNIPFLYRIHEPPTTEDMKEFSRFIEGMGYQLAVDKSIHPSDLQKILNETTEAPEERIIAWNILRSMKQARYSPENMGHFGLASDCYCHFTSPIRRYPDLTVHRVLKSVIDDGTIDQDSRNTLQEDLPQLGRHTSDREQNATDAERESKTVKLLEYMRDRIGDEMEGYVTSVLEFGCFVQIENTLEGLIHVSNLDDYYIFDEDNYTLTAETGDNVIHIGDHVRVQVARVDVPQRELDFELIEVLKSHLGDYSG